MVLDRRTWCKELMNVEIDLKQRDMSNFAGYGCPSFDECPKENCSGSCKWQINRSHILNITYV